jgi:hypothetical protein
MGPAHRFCSSHRLCEPKGRNDDEHNSAISPRVAPELLHQSFAQSGRGECRVPAAPAASCAKCRKHTSVVTTSSPEHPAFPHAMVLTAYFALSPAIGLSCHRRLADTSAKLDAGVEASGPHDFTVREPGASRQKRSPRPPHSVPRP